MSDAEANGNGAVPEQGNGDEVRENEQTVAATEQTAADEEMKPVSAAVEEGPHQEKQNGNLDEKEDIEGKKEDSSEQPSTEASDKKGSEALEDGRRRSRSRERSRRSRSRERRRRSSRSKSRERRRNARSRSRDRRRRSRSPRRHRSRSRDRRRRASSRDRRRRSRSRDRHSRRRSPDRRERERPHARRHSPLPEQPCDSYAMKVLKGLVPDESEVPPAIVHQQIGATSTLSTVAAGLPSVNMAGQALASQAISSGGAAQTVTAGSNPQETVQSILARLQQQAATPTANAATTKPLRELYVGNLPVGASSTQLQELLGALLQQMGAVTQPGNPIVNVWMSADSHFAFCEFRTIEETNNAQMLNGVTLMGQSLRIGRPKGFEQAIANNPQMAALAAGGKPPAAGLGMGAAALPGMGMPGMTGLAGMGGMGGMMGMNPMQLMGMMSMAGLSTAMTGTAGVPGVGGLTGLASTAAGTTAMGGAGVPGTATTAAVTSSGAKLRIMNAPATLDADILLSMVAPFGPVKAHRKCAGPSADAHFFDFEYEDPATGKVALPALNDLSIGPVKLKVVLLPDNIQIGSSTTDAAAATTTAAATTGAVANPAADPAHPANKPPTCTLKLQNMVTDEELANPEDVADIEEEVKEEAGKFGSVNAVVIPQPTFNPPPHKDNLGCVFVSFTTPDDTRKAFLALHGRKFDERTVVGSYVSDELFAAKAFDRAD